MERGSIPKRDTEKINTITASLAEGFVSLLGWIDVMSSAISSRATP
jgi:hypothetical protein